MKELFSTGINAGGFHIEMNNNDIFYKENDQFLPIHRGISLVRHNGFTIGRAHNGIVLPIFNNHHQMIVTNDHNLTIHVFVTDMMARQMGVWGPVPVGLLQPSSSRNKGNQRRHNRRES